MGQPLWSGATANQYEDSGHSSNSCCTFLLMDRSATNAAPASAVQPVEERSCHAIATPFVPSQVHQSSCCLNPANFMRCPYYLAAMGQQKRQLDLQIHKRSVTGRMRQQLARILSFGRADRKKRKRIYYTI